MLSAYWQDKIAVVWTTDDVHGVQEDFDEDEISSSLSDEQALLILLSAFENQGLHHGITWDSLKYWSQELLEEAST